MSRRWKLYFYQIWLAVYPIPFSWFTLACESLCKFPKLNSDINDLQLQLTFDENIWQPPRPLSFSNKMPTVFQVASPIPRRILTRSCPSPPDY